ncbi:BnaA04g27320D [Brassica napus]|uniref:BnaA04g27320D protein n=1 Tax=Brassica napus TaxID=3708 RepID=A0A078J1H3_BRANA|nr:BnaA04g27320D [Brassica napus]
MSSPSAVGDLLAALSYRLENGNRVLEEELNESSSSIGRAISELNRSLTLDTNGEDSGFSVLDATVSLMCFKAPQVFDSVVEFLVKTIVSVLSSSSSCKVIRYHNDEALQFGSLSLPCCSEELIEISKDIIDKLGVNGGLATLLFQAVVRSAASTSFRARKLADGRNMGVSKLLAYLPRESSIENDKIPLRILFWYQDPLSLKEDVSRILKDLVERPFLCLNKELFERGEWRDVVVCLALSPSMFINARALLHKWFLLTGLASVFDLLAALVSAVVDTVSRPTLWGIPMELASMLPFSDAYFPHQCQFLRILAGPLTSNSLVTLAHSCKPTPIKVQALDDKTEWALAINFPDWFYFASAMLFSGGSSLENIHHGYASHSQVSNIIPPCGVEGLSVAAATYIAWILNPASGTIQESLTKSLIRVSEMLRRSETTTGKRKKPASSIVDDLVREFHNKITNSFSCELDNMQNNLLVRRVVVGVLICSPYTVTDEEYELVLHYAATGKHLAVKKLRFNGFKQAKGSSKTSMLQSNEITKEEAVEGTRLVFNLTDTLESMCASSFEAEEDAHEYINQFKLRSSKYLVKCIDRLIQLHCEEDGDLILNDINIRLEQWSMKGPEDPQLKEDLDTIAAKLAFIFSPV